MSFMVGQAIVTKVHETTLVLPAAKLLPDYDPAAVGPELDRLGPDHVDPRRERLTLSVHSWLVRIGALTVLVDTGIGNSKFRTSALFDRLDTPWLARLERAGARPGDVTHVLLTHLHTDHVGWNTVREGERWVPTFPNARTVMPRLGFEQFTEPRGRTRPNYDMFADSVLPVIEAGRGSFVGSGGGEPLPGFTFVPTPGHSPDHMSILLRSEGQEALFTGDILHHPVQMACPDWCSMFCAAPNEARRSRRRMLDLAAERGLLYFSSHIAGASAGYVHRIGNRYAWRSADDAPAGVVG